MRGHWFQSALRFAVVSDQRGDATREQREMVSIRFEVRGGFRRRLRCHRSRIDVSIRFEVRGGFRRRHVARVLAHHWFQSALRFAVVSDSRSGSRS